MEGWISLHRRFLNWEWYDDNNTMKLFIHILLKANHKKKNWKGIVIDKGQLLTGRKQLSYETKLSEQQIRTSLKKLISTNEITIKATSLYSLVSITNWNKYQGSNQGNNQQVTNEQPTDNQQVTTTNNVNNEKNVNNDNNKEVVFDNSIETKNKFNEGQTKLLNFLCDKFGVSELNQPQNYFLIHNAIKLQITTGKYEWFSGQIHFYFKFKDKSKQNIHGLKSFIGELDEIELGNWNAENWDKKYQALKQQDSTEPKGYVQPNAQHRTGSPVTMKQLIKK